MSSIEIEVATPEAMTALGERIGAQLRAGDLLALNGELGAGKTTFTRGIGAALGVRGAVTSPTFVLARTHLSESGGAPLVHVDAYRLVSALELDDLEVRAGDAGRASGRYTVRRRGGSSFGGRIVLGVVKEKGRVRIRLIAAVPD